MLLNVGIPLAVATAVPILWIVVVRYYDVLQTAKTRILVACVLWGAVGAFGLAYLVNNGFVNLLVNAGLSGAQSYQLLVRFAAPVIEEILKATFLFFLIRRPSFVYFVDGAIYGFGVGIGFAVTENWFYILNNTEAGWGVAFSRVISTVLMHGMASAVVGLALGQLRRAQGGKAQALPLLGIGGAIAAHVIYNNIVNVLSGVELLLVAIALGLGGAGVIILQIQQGIASEKRQFGRIFGDGSDISGGEVKAIQRIGGGSFEELLAQLSDSFGTENINLIRRMLITQANLGILENNLRAGGVSARLREAWEQDARQLRAEYQTIRRELGYAVTAYMQSMFPPSDETLWEGMQEKIAESDPTMVNRFDIFMRTSGLAATFTPEELEARAERLQRIEIFRDVSLGNLENMGRAIEIVDYQDGTMLFDEGDDGDAMYLIEQGAINIYAVDAQGGERFLRSFGPGSVVGDFAVLDGQPRSARARAHGALRVLVLKREMFRVFIQSRPQVILSVLRVLAEKARFTTDAVDAYVTALGDIARGNYEAVANLASAPEPVALTEDSTEPAVTEISSSWVQALNVAFSRFAGSLQRRAPSQPAQAAGSLDSRR